MHKGLLPEVCHSTVRHPLIQSMMCPAWKLLSKQTTATLLLLVRLLGPVSGLIMQIMRTGISPDRGDKLSIHYYFTIILLFPITFSETIV